MRTFASVVKHALVLGTALAIAAGTAAAQEFAPAYPGQRPPDARLDGRRREVEGMSGRRAGTLAGGSRSGPMKAPTAAMSVR